MSGFAVRDNTAAPGRTGAEPGPGGPGFDGPGFYGKVCAKGDFVSRRLPRSFVGPWDAWLQAALAESRERLGEDWAPAYMTAPIWRFVLSSGLCGDRVVSGVLMPSVDRVGRQFPLALAALLGQDANPWEVFLSGAEWFARLEDLALSSLDDDFDFDGFDDSVAGCGPPPHGAGSRLGAAPGEVHAGSSRWRFPVEPGGAAGAAQATVVHHVLSAALSRYSLWWGAGSDRVAPSLLVCDGLPGRANFAALLDGRFGEWGWSGGETDGRADAQDPR